MPMPAARITDMHVCPMVTPGLPPIPHVGGPVVSPGAPTVLIATLPAAAIGSMCVCVGPPDSIIMGSPTVLVSGMPLARMTDPTAHGGVIVAGAPTVMVGP
jgi:uncharacterized Zn-binding protein involved in type VI secretion